MAAMFAHENDDDSDVVSDEEKEHPPLKKCRTNALFDKEAEALGDEEEDDDHASYDVVKKHYIEEDIRREQMDEGARELIRQQDRRRAESGGDRLGDKSVADMAKDIEDRHRMSRWTVHVTVASGGPDGDETYGDANYTSVSQQSLVPSISDPNLWMILCSSGKEEELLFQIMNKCIAFARQGRPLGIKAAIAAQSKGKIYVESYSEPAVVEAIKSIRGLIQYSMRIVPIQDMTVAMTVTQQKKPGM